MADRSPTLVGRGSGTSLKGSQSDYTNRTPVVLCREIAEPLPSVGYPPIVNERLASQEIRSTNCCSIWATAP